MIEAVFGRRKILGAGLTIAALAAMPSAARAALTAVPERRLAFRNVHTGERFDACYFSNGRFRSDGLAELNHALRDWRTNQATNMDPRLLELLVDLRNKLDLPAGKQFDLISGYRSPATNGALHQHSQGVATKSQHMLGKATDIALPGVRIDRIRDAALAMGRGGVGFYPADGFVHVDTGRVRHWG